MTRKKQRTKTTPRRYSVFIKVKPCVKNTASFGPGPSFSIGVQRRSKGRSRRNWHVLLGTGAAGTIYLEPDLESKSLKAGRILFRLQKVLGMVPWTISAPPLNPPLAPWSRCVSSRRGRGEPRPAGRGTVHWRPQPGGKGGATVMASPRSFEWLRAQTVKPTYPQNLVSPRISAT